MEIDEERNLVLTKYAKRKGEKVVCQSDHNVMWCKKNIPWISYIKRDRTERLNLRDKESQQEGFLRCQTPISTLRLKVEV